MSKSNKSNNKPKYNSMRVIAIDNHGKKTSKNIPLAKAPADIRKELEESNTPPFFIFGDASEVLAYCEEHNIKL